MGQWWLGLADDAVILKIFGHVPDDFRFKKRGQRMRKVKIVDDPLAQRCWIAVDLKSGEPVLLMHDRGLLERICQSLEWKIVQANAQRG
jgi:hypothetical protein